MCKLDLFAKCVLFTSISLVGDQRGHESDEEARRDG